MDEPISKSQKKRDAESLQKMGVELIELSETILKTLELPEVLFKALIEAKHLKSHGAMRRQAQLIGKIMRNTDYELIAQRYANIKAEQQAKTSSFHEVEEWRTRLIEEGKDALTDFLFAYPDANKQELRQLIKKAIDDKTRDRIQGGSKALFRFLRGCIQ